MHFHKDGKAYADFQGELTLLGGLIPDDLRDAPVAAHNKSIAHGKITVTIADKVWYRNEALIFDVDGVNPNEDTEKWEFKNDHQEVQIEWKNHVDYVAKEDPGVDPKVFGTLSSRFIHSDKTELRWNTDSVALPASLTYNGLVVASLEADGVATIGPGASSIDQHGKSVDIDIPLKLVPGDKVKWDAGIGTATPRTYEHTIGSGTATEVYYIAGGKFDIRVPRVDTTIGYGSPSLTATVVLQVGDSTVACATFSVNPYVLDGKEHWKFHYDDE